MIHVTAVILAGGKGTRIRELYPDVPKPMIQIGGRPFLHWPTAFFASHDVRHFVYSTGHKGEQIRKWCEDSSMPGLTRIICHENEPLGTGGGLLNCLVGCGEWVVVANGDSLCLAGVPEILALADNNNLAGGIIGIYQEDTSSYGSLELDEQGRLLSFREKISGKGYINAGIYLFNTKVLHQLQMQGPCSIEHDLIPKLLQAGEKIQVILVHNAPFIDIGTPESIRYADNFVRENQASFNWTI